MSELPIGWVDGSLGELLAVLRGVSYKKDDARSEAADELIPLLRASNIQASGIVLSDFVFVPKKYVSDEQRLREGDIVIAASSGSISVVGKAARVVGAEPMTFGAFCYALRVNRGISNEFVSYFLQSPFYRKAISRLSAGININNLKREHIATFPISLPPFDEQRRIVAKLDALLEKSGAIRDKLDRLQRLLDQLKKSILNAAFRGDLTREWREISEARADAWCDTTLADVAVEFSYGSSAKSRPDGKIPVLRMGNIQDGRLAWSDLVYTDDRAEIEKYRLDSGDVLFNRTNSPDLVGKSAVFRGEREAIYAGYLIRVRCGKDLNPDFLAYLLNGPRGRQYCWQVKSDGVSQSNINARKLAAFSFQIPAALNSKR
jgi:type I restriction enzyme S subunit